MNRRHLFKSLLAPFVPVPKAVPVLNNFHDLIESDGFKQARKNLLEIETILANMADATAGTRGVITNIPEVLPRMKTT